MAHITRRVHLTFPAEQIKEPVVYRLSKNYDVVTNIRRAAIEEDFGWMVLEITGDSHAIDDGFKYLQGLGIQVDPVEGDIVEG